MISDFIHLLWIVYIRSLGSSQSDLCQLELGH